MTAVGMSYVVFFIPVFAFLRGNIVMDGNVWQLSLMIQQVVWYVSSPNHAKFVRFHSYDSHITPVT